MSMDSWEGGTLAAGSTFAKIAGQPFALAGNGGLAG
jgi:hypothetical protein